MQKAIPYAVPLFETFSKLIHSKEINSEQAERIFQVFSSGLTIESIKKGHEPIKETTTLKCKNGDVFINRFLFFLKYLSYNGGCNVFLDASLEAERFASFDLSLFDKKTVETLKKLLL